MPIRSVKLPWIFYDHDADKNLTWYSLKYSLLNRVWYKPYAGCPNRPAEKYPYYVFSCKAFKNYV